MANALNESEVVGSFLYLWGFYDAATGKKRRPALLAQAQNKLDHLLGDLFGQVSPTNELDRWFLAEFKAGPSGFKEEVVTKPHRLELLNLINAGGGPMRRLSGVSHLAVWLDALGDIRWDAYAYMANGTPNPAPAPWSFEVLYRGLNNDDGTPAQFDQGLFLKGQGVPREAMLEYLDHVIEAHLAAKKEVGNPQAEADYLFLGHKAYGGFAPTIVPVDFVSLASRCIAYKASVTRSSNPPKISASKLS